MATIVKRTNRKGEVTWQARVRLFGHEEVSETFQRLTDAKRWAAQTETAIRQGRHFPAAESRRHTGKEMLERYIREILPTKRPSTASGQILQAHWWIGELGHRVLADITPPRVAEARDKLLTNRSHATCNRYLAVLSNCFTVAQREWQWVEHNPVRAVRRGKESRGRVRFLSDDERKQLLEACRRSSRGEWLYPLVVLALSTGMRQAEMLWLFWSKPKEAPGNAWGVVYLAQKAVILYSTKNEETRRVPLTGLALELLRERAKVRRLDSALVFPSIKDPRRPITVKSAWLGAVRAAGIEDFHFHDLRHSAASYLAMNGASLLELATLLGHKTLAMVQRYAHLSESHTRAIVERMNKAIFDE